MPRPGLLLAAALTWVALVYLNALEVPFVRDDHHLIRDDALVHELRPLGDYFARAYWAEPTGPTHRAYYRPLVTLSFALDWQLWNGNPRGFHATNLLLHLLACGLVFALARRAGASAGAAALAAALFGTFPRLTEAVTWISGRTDLLAGVAVLGALLVWRSEPRRHAARCAAAALLFAGLLCKEVALAGFAALAALELARARSEEGTLARSALLLAPLAVALGAWLLLRSAIGATAFPDLFGWPLRGLLALQAAGSYALMLLDPLRPRLVIGRLGVIEPWLVLVGGVALCGVVALGLRLLRPPVAPLAAACFGLGVGALLPVLHLVPLPVAVVAADRFLFLPAAALAVGLAGQASALPRWGARTAGLALLGVCLAFGLGTALRNQLWRDELGLWLDAHAVAPAGSSQERAELGALYSWRGQSARALEHYAAAYSIEREFAERYPRAGVDRRLRGNLALVLSELGRFDESIDLLERSVGEQPGDPRARLDLGAVLARDLQLDAAERELDHALRLHPDFALASKLRAQVRRARELWPGVPPEPGVVEPAGRTAARALCYFLVGRLADAEMEWARVAAAKDASDEQLLGAARYLVRRGRDADVAERALARLRSGAAVVAEVQALDRARLRRFALSPPNR